MFTGGHHAIFSVLEVKRSKVLQKVNKRDEFVYILGFICYGVSAQKILFYFVLDSFFEQNHLLNLIILEAYAKR